MASLSDPGNAADAGPRLTIAAGYDANHYPVPARTQTARAIQAPEGDQEAGHVDPATAARWRQAQTELAGLIRVEHRTRKPSQYCPAS